MLIIGILDYLSPAYTSRGIISDASKTLLYKWGIPRMNIRKMVGTVYTGNGASVKVLEKLGFKMREVYKDLKEVKGTIRSVCVLEWALEEDESTTL
jgi:RimJ/RimL family protein N-acetyltransferase